MKIVVLGGGFAGIAAARTLRKISKEHEVTLIDKNDYTTMLPSLPDVAGGRIKPQFVREYFEHLLPESITFLQRTVIGLDFDTRVIETTAGDLTYDYLIFAPGSRANFYGFNENLDKLYTLASVDDAVRIRDDFRAYLAAQGNKGTVVISGAGFTGIELATNFIHLSRECKAETTVYLVERGARMLAMLSDKLYREVAKEADYLGLKILTEELVTHFDGNNVVLKKYGEIKNAFFCWCSGVRLAVDVRGEKLYLDDKEKSVAIFDGRLRVNKTLQLEDYPEVFPIGDAAAVLDKGDKFLRRAANFSSLQGVHAADNLINLIRGKKLRLYSPIDLGWVIPMNLTSVGMSMGIQIHGRIGVIMHYMICGFKNYNIRNLFKFLRAGFKFTLHRHDTKN